MGRQRSWIGVLQSVIVVSILAFGVPAPAQGLGPLESLFGGFRSTTECYPSGGRAITVERFEPSGSRCCRLPAVLILHGADGLCRFGEEYRTAAKGLAREGYVAIIVHYFDATGCGPDLSHGMKIDPRLFAIWSHTVADGIKYASCLPNVDANRIGLVGFSLGSYIAVGLGATHPQVRAVVELFGGIPEPLVKRFRSSAPVLILHGEADHTVPVTEAWKLARVLRSHGVPYEMMTYPCQGHELQGEAKEDAVQRTLCFLERYLKAR